MNKFSEFWNRSFETSTTNWWKLIAFYHKIECLAIRRNVNLVDLVKRFPTAIWLQKSASIQRRTSRIKNDLSRPGAIFKILGRSSIYVCRPSKESLALDDDFDAPVAGWIFWCQSIHTLALFCQSAKLSTYLICELRMYQQKKFNIRLMAESTNTYQHVECIEFFG